MIIFVSQKGEKFTCKFCNAEIGVEIHPATRAESGRVYNLDGKTFHSDTCAPRKAYYKAVAADRAQARRDERFRGMR